jgi:flagellar basal-body rod protein FlgG
MPRELYITGGPLDLSIEGPGFFALRRRDGSRALTRTGTFTVDSAGLVVTPYGDRLDPPLVLPFRARPEDVRIGPDGRAAVPQRAVGRVGVVDVPEPCGLVEVGPSIFAPTLASGVPTPVESPVRQGTLEL